MLTLNIIGKNFQSDSVADDENEIKILLEPSQIDGVKRAIEFLGFTNIMLEDDEGNLYLTASKETVKEENKIEEEVKPAAEVTQPPLPVVIQKTPKTEIIKNSTGVLISCENQKYNSIFMRKFLSSLVNSRIKPDIVALMNGGVKMAAYNSPTCEYLKKLEADGVKILISDSCSDRIGITEAIGVGDLVDMSEILEEIFVCERIVNV